MINVACQIKLIVRSLQCENFKPLFPGKNAYDKNKKLKESAIQSTWRNYVAEVQICYPLYMT